VFNGDTAYITQLKQQKSKRWNVGLLFTKIDPPPSRSIINKYSPEHNGANQCTECSYTATVDRSRGDLHIIPWRFRGGTGTCS